MIKRRRQEEAQSPKLKLVVTISVKLWCTVKEIQSLWEEGRGVDCLNYPELSEKKSIYGQSGRASIPGADCCSPTRAG